MFPPQGGLEGSVLTFHCDPGKYPFPVSDRVCGPDGEWSPMRLANGKQVQHATCKGNEGNDVDDAFSIVCNVRPLWGFSQSRTLVFHLILPLLPASSLDVLCPAQLQLDNGDFWPRDQWLGVGKNQTFSCLDGFTLYGSAERICTASGSWTGTPPVCDNHGEEEEEYKQIICGWIIIHGCMLPVPRRSRRDRPLTWGHERLCAD